MIRSEERISGLIKVSRFPLIVLVLFIHVLPERLEPVVGDRVGVNLFHIVSELISHNLGRIAVPCFFMISGYLFFSKLPDAVRLSFFIDKWKSRSKSLLIPYLIWNVLLVVAILLKNAGFEIIGLPHDDGYGALKALGVYGILWSMPINIPLWYLRDLICMVALSPFFYLIMRRNPFGIMLFYLLYIGTVESGVPGLSSTSFFYFGFGSWLSLNHIRIELLLDRIDWRIVLISGMTLIAATMLNCSIYHEVFCRVFIPLWSLVFFKILDLLAEIKSIARRLSSLSASVFFIYANHEIYILNWTKGLFLRIFGEGLYGSCMSYIFVPLIVLLVCLSLFSLMNHLIPRTLAFICGGRITAKK